MSLIAHVSVGTKDVARSGTFYDAVLKPLGAIRAMDFTPYAIGFGTDPKAPDFWVQLPADQKPASAGNGVHICFAAKTRAQVDAFHAAAIRAGGHDAGAPGLRPDYSPDYYAAFAYDLDGNKIEAVTFAP